MRVHYVLPQGFGGAQLTDELLTAGVSLTAPVAGQGPDLWLTVADTQDPGAVEAVVSAHQPVVALPAELVQDASHRSTLRLQAPNMVTRLDAIQADMVTLGNHAETLSTITVTNLAQVQTVLRSLGADLIILTDDVQALALGSERILRAMDSIIRPYGQQA